VFKFSTFLPSVLQSTAHLCVSPVAGGGWWSF